MLAPGTVQRARSCHTEVDEAGGPLGIADGNRDGNDGTHRQPRATVNSQSLSHVLPEPGIRYT
jgi:hypothetical protein